MLKNGKWSKKYDRCIICKRNDKKYGSEGLCINCYVQKINKNNPEKNRSRALEWQKENLERVKDTKRKYYKENREKIIESSKKWQEENFEKAKDIKRRYYKENSEKLNKSSKKWREKNVEKCKKDNRIKTINYYHNNLRYKLKSCISCSIRGRLKSRLSSKKGKSTFDFLPYTVDELIQHLENLFEPWMNWDNWGIGKGKWNIDHKVPDSNFNYKSVEDKEFQKCWALSNLRPLDAIENIKKSDKVLNFK